MSTPRLPTTEWVKALQDADKESRKRWLGIVENEQRYRHSQTRLGQFTGVIVALSFLGCATYLVAIGQPVAGTVLGTVDIVALVTVFVATERIAATKSTNPSADNP